MPRTFIRSLLMGGATAAFAVVIGAALYAFCQHVLFPALLAWGFDEIGAFLLTLLFVMVLVVGTIIYYAEGR